MDEQPMMTATTDWDAGLFVSITLDTSYEPLCLDILRSQLIATFEGLGFTDNQINQLFQ